MPDGSTVTYIYDGTFEGWLSAVFEAYARKSAEAEILSAYVQPEWGREYREVATDAEKASRVTRGIRSRMGTEVYHTIWTAFLSDAEDVGTVLYRYVRFGFEVGTSLTRRMTDPRVLAVNKLASLVTREAGHLLQFVRFAQTITGVYYAEISPQYAVLPILMPHFSHRMGTQAFVIYDNVHRCSGLSDGKRWVLTSVDGVQTPDLSESERAYRKLWKTFYDTVAVKERVNPALRQRLMPKKFWKNMVEMTERPVSVDSASAQSPSLQTESDETPQLP